MNASIELLHRGDKTRPLFVPWNDPARASFAELSQSWQMLQPHWQAAPATRPASDATGRPFHCGRSSGWCRRSKAMTRLTAILNLFQFFMMGLAVVAAVFTLYVGYLYVIDPLQRLRAGLRPGRAGGLRCPARRAGP